MSHRECEIVKEAGNVDEVMFRDSPRVSEGWLYALLCPNRWTLEIKYTQMIHAHIPCLSVL